MSPIIQRILPVTVLLLLTALAAGAASRGEPVSLEVGESAQVAELTLSFLGVDGDNRCPADVQCIVGGEATVRLRVEASDAAAIEVRIDVPPGAKAKGRARDDEIEVDLEPETRAGEKIDSDAYVVTLVVDRPAN